MAKANPLQEQLLKAGLVKKSKVAAVAREQHLARDARAAHGPNEIEVEAQRARAEKIERDRALEAGRRQQARTQELRAQARQIIRDKGVPHGGEIDYRFTAGGAIRSLPVSEDLRRKLAGGALVVADGGDGYRLLPRAAAEQVRGRDAAMIVLDHGQAADAPEAAADTADAAYYAQFEVPDDLVW